jgi:aminoglycoside/choline kinase family phosphotransferase
MGLQRHVKILGVFSRLWLRDQKPAYMHDIPVVIDYIREACGLYSKDYSAIADFWKWFEDTVLPRVQQADWYATYEARDDFSCRRGAKNATAHRQPA